MLGSRPFRSLQVVGAAQGQVPLEQRLGRSSPGAAGSGSAVMSPPPPPPSQLPALCRLQDAPAAPGSWKPRMRTCVSWGSSRRSHSSSHSSSPGGVGPPPKEAWFGVPGGSFAQGVPSAPCQTFSRANGVFRGGCLQP
ncbi:unnamed protein product [Rangifer tarandus platyrhynchus]|uniref:Uncharacterized protein n=1 Tax=Rangifer tarandus platyrhynchus TaxID=3082113 RepID=A0AC59YP14_RANTA